MTKPSIDRIIRDSRAECLVLSRGEAKVMVDEIVRLRLKNEFYLKFIGWITNNGGGTGRMTFDPAAMPDDLRALYEQVKE